MGKIIAVCLGKTKDRPKKRVDRAYLKNGHGIIGDIHAGPGKRQISILAMQDIKALRNKGIDAQSGDFAENIILKGIDFFDIIVGSRLKIGQAALGITELGKKGWKPGDYSFRGIPLVAQKGVFASVLKSGWIKSGDDVGLL